MLMTFNVGVNEQHTVSFYFDKFWGRLKIQVNGEKVVSTVRVFSFSTSKVWEFDVGINEIHRVRIEKHREVFFAGFRPQPVYAFVDGVLVAQAVA